MDGARSFHTQIVIGCNDIYHIHIGSCDGCQGKRIPDDALDMAETVALSESIIAWENLTLHEGHYFEVGLRHDRR